MPWFGHMINFSLDDPDPTTTVVDIVYCKILPRLRDVGVTTESGGPNIKQLCLTFINSSSWKKSFINLWTEWNSEYVDKIKQQVGAIRLWTMLKNWEQYCDCDDKYGSVMAHWETCSEMPWKQLFEMSADQNLETLYQYILENIDLKRERIRTRLIKGLSPTNLELQVVCDKTDTVLSPAGTSFKRDYQDLIFCAIYLYGDQVKGLSLYQLKYHLSITNGNRKFLDALRHGVVNHKFKKKKGFY